MHSSHWHGSSTCKNVVQESLHADATFCEILLTQISFDLAVSTIWAVTEVSLGFNSSGPCGFLFFWNSSALHRTVTVPPLACIGNHPQHPQGGSLCLCPACCRKPGSTSWLPRVCLLCLSTWERRSHPPLKNPPSLPLQPRPSSMSS